MVHRLLWLECDLFPLFTSFSSPLLRDLLLKKTTTDIANRCFREKMQVLASPSLACEDVLFPRAAIRLKMVDLDKVP